MNILIIDDQKLIVDDLTYEVKNIMPGAYLDGFTDANEALDSAQKTQYDVAMLDIDMPVMNGLTLARKLIATNQFINIIFVTGYKEYAYEAHELYCSAFLTKPVGSKKLKSAFDNLRNQVINLPEGFTNEHYSGEALIGQKLKALREQRNISRQELADLMDVTRQTVHRWEQGERVPDVVTFFKLLRLLGASTEDIIG